MKKLFVLLGMLFSINTVFSQNIIKAEYFLDADPGQGNGSPIPNFTAGDIVNVSFTIPTSGLSDGFHFLNIRVVDVNGLWSRYETRYFYLSTTNTNTTNITAAEYFIDRDTIPGSGTPINIGAAGPIVNFTLAFPATLSSGFHSLAIRVKDQEGKWSIFEERSFYIAPDPVDAPPIVAAEYFFDVDPGIGSASPLSVTTPGNIVTQTFLVAVPNSLPQGDHVLAIRVKDQQGHWSFYAKDTISVSNGATISCPSNITVSASAGQCTAIVNGIDPTIVPAGTSYTYTLSGATTGTGTGTASGKTFNSGVTTVTYALTNSPATNCSFTVTVTSNITASVSINASATTICSGQQVTFTAVPVNGGNTPVYQWKKNGNNIAGATNPTYQSSSLANGDIISVVLNSSLACANPSSVASNNIPITVNPSVTPTVIINASATSICAGHMVAFTSVAVNGGNSPAYQWKKNGNNIAGATNPSYQSSSFANGDIISLVMNSSAGCATPSSVASNNIPITIKPSVTPSVSITASATSICPGQTVTFTATPVNPGAQPLFQWVKNGVMTDQGTTYQTSALSNGDSVYVILYNTTDCIPDYEIISNVIYITVAQTVTPAVTISQSPTIICSGSVVTFTANPVNGGSTPSYQWKVNDINVGNNSNTYTPPAPVNGNVVKVIMNSSLGCASSPSATSNSITMMVDDSVQEFVSITASATTICAGTLVTFAAAESGGGSGTFQWKLNGNNVGTNSLIYRTDSLRNGDKVKVVFATTFPCSPPLVASNEITITVNSASVPSVSILASTTNICASQQVTFTATPINGGATPSYQWKLNGNNVGSNSPTYQNSALQNGDSVRVVMTSSLASLCQTTASSNRITMSVGQMVIPSVSINASAIDICAGQQVIFTATPTNGGNNPTYQWKLNGNNVGSNSPTYQTTSLVNADTVKVVMTSSLSCVVVPIATSNSISMDVSTSIIPSVSITADLTYICQGELVSFTATPTNGGNPTYQWKLNGNNVGTNSNIYQSTSFANNDSIEVVMTSSLGCAVPQSVKSNNIFMTVTTSVTPQVSIESSSSYVCPGTLITFIATPVNGGTPSYQWKLNGNNVGTDYYKYENSSLSVGDIISVSMTSTLGCVTTSTAVSNNITMAGSSSSTTYYRDLDGDGYGNSSSGTVQACGKLAGYVSNDSDCNDNNPSVHPGAVEICGNGIDDDCNGQIDEGCNTTLPTLILRTYPVKEGDAGQTILNVEVTLNIPAPLPVSVHYATSNEDATAGLDYVASNGLLLIPAGATSGSVQVRIIGDLLKESNERFRLNFANPVNVVLSGDPYSRIMIIDDDKGKPNSAARSDELSMEEAPFKIPTVTRRNQIWVIPQIGNYENEVLIINQQGQLVNRFINYQNRTPVGNVSTGIYFYRIRIAEKPGQYKFYSGRLLITE